MVAPVSYPSPFRCTGVRVRSGDGGRRAWNGERGGEMMTMMTMTLSLYGENLIVQSVNDYVNNSIMT